MKGASNMILYVAAALIILISSVSGNNNYSPALEPILQNISEWIVGETNLPSNNITNARDTLSTSIFINGNLARVLIASAKIFKNQTYLNVGLAWCDTLVTLQNDALTHDGKRVGGWWDTGYSELYSKCFFHRIVAHKLNVLFLVADTGTAVTALALCYDALNENGAEAAARREAYLFGAYFFFSSMCNITTN